MRIGLIGTGTIGGGVVEILEAKTVKYRETLGLELELAYICAKDDTELAPYKAKGYRTTTDAMEMIADPSKNSPAATGYSDSSILSPGEAEICPASSGS